MSRFTVVLLAVLLAACAESGEDRQEQEHFAGTQERALDKAREARAEAEAAMEETRKTIEDTRDP